MAWREWTLGQWNDALVDIVFTRRSDNSPEILRIDATSRLLALAAHADDDDADSVRGRFLDSFPKDLWRLRAFFYVGGQTTCWTPGDADLPFFAQLYLTILVASADEDTFDIGNFRSRFRTILGIDVSIGHFLNDLPELWRAAASWSRKTLRQNVRRLVLPDPGHETIIGYSKRLAFPGFDDQTKLAALLAENGLDAGSPEYRIVRAVGGTRHRFSMRFREEFDQFLRFLSKGDRVGAARSPFWGAVLEIDWDVQPRQSEQRERFELELDPRDPHASSLMLLASGEHEEEDWSSRKLPFTAGDMKYEVQAKNLSGRPLLDLLASSSGKRLIGGTPLSDWLQRGWLGFCRDDMERWTASSNFADAEYVWLLVREDRWPRVAGLLKFENRLPNYALEGVLSDHWVLTGQFRNNAGLAGILAPALGDRDAFAPRVLSPQIRVLESLRLPEGILLVAPYSPRFSARGADRMSWSSKMVTHTDRRWLREAGDPPGAFVFETADLASLPASGDIELCAYDEADDEIDRRSIPFVTRCLSHEIKRPADPGAYLKAGDHGQLVAAFDADENDRRPRSKAANRILPIDLGSHRSQTVVRIGIEAIPRPWGNCLEVLTALFSTRASVPTTEFLEIVRRVWDVPRGEAWRRIDDLVANGFVQQLQLRRWRGSVFVGVPPRALIVDRGRRIVCRLTGLLPTSARLTLWRSVTACGGSCELIASGDLEFIGALEIKVAKEELVSELAKECRFIEMSRGLSRDFVFPDWATVLANISEFTPGIAPEGWDASEGKFGAAGIAISRNDVRLERWVTERAQPLYRLTYGNRHWTTRSRLWAMLGYNAVFGRSIGAVDSEGTVVLEPGLSLSPGFTQRVLYYGAGVCVRDSRGSRVYPGASQWSIPRALRGWIKSPLPNRASVSTAVLRYREALRRTQLHRNEPR